MARVCQFADRFWAAEKDLEPFLAALVLVDEQMAEHALLTAGTEKTKAEHDTLAASNLELEVATAASN